MSAMSTPPPVSVSALAEMEARLVRYINGNATALQADLNATKRDFDIAWLVLCGALVMFMQAGFAMLEAGIVQPKNMSNILFKNMVDCSIAAVCFWTVGYGLAFGKDKTGFIGGSKFGAENIYNGAGVGSTSYAPASGSDGWEFWFFQWAFTGTCATIVAGSLAERTRLEAYFLYSFVLTAVIYPVIVHWAWGEGELPQKATCREAHDTCACN
jgi:Amt family ammonium transporter